MSHDLVIENRDGEQHSYVIAADQSNPLVHTTDAPNVPLSGSGSTPAQAGGQYDVRDSGGDKAIAHIDWTLGAGQQSLDATGASPYMFQESRNCNIAHPGRITLSRAVEYSALALAKGPVFSAMGYFFLGMDSNSGTATPLKVSTDGVNWTTPTITANPAINALISCFASDGSNVYFGVASGANRGIWKGVLTATWTFTKLASSGEEVKGLAFNGGQMFACVVSASASRVAMVNASTGLISPQVAGSKNSTPAMFNVVNHVALVTASNSSFWIVSQGNKSFIYRIYYEPDAGTMLTEQFAEMPTGFIATCALGYLSEVYIGGYFESQTANVGKGGVYRCDDSLSAPLFEIGEYPEDTPNPSDTANDNRINTICEAGKDLYVGTNRGVYRWDIDGTGYSHAFDLNTGGAGTTAMTWNAGSDYSYDGTDLTNAPIPGPAHGRFPTAWTQTDTVDTAIPNDNYVHLTTQGSNQIGLINSGSDCYFLFSEDDYAMGWTDATKFSFNGLTVTWVGGTHSYFNLTGVCTLDTPISGLRTFRVTLTGRNVTTQTWANNIVMCGTSSPLKPYYACDWTHTGGIATLVRGGKTVLTCTPSGGDALDNATGCTTEFITGTDHNAVMTYEVKDGTKVAQCTIESDKVTIGQRLVTYTNTAVVPHGGTFYNGAWYNVSYWTRTWTVSGGAWYSDVPFSSRFDPNEQIAGNTQPALLAGDRCSLAEDITPITTTLPNPRTVRFTLKGNLVTLTVNYVGGGGIAYDTKTLNVTPAKYNTASKLLTITMPKLSSVDSWQLNSTSAVPSQNEVEVLSWAGVAYSKGILLSPYTIPSDATTGVAHTVQTYAESGYLTQSETSFHSGTLGKDFRIIDVAHSPLPDGCSLGMIAWVDGEAFILEPAYGTTSTRFILNKRGYSIKTQLSMSRATGYVGTPTITAVNVIWDFVKIHTHKYLLDCRTGAANGRWDENPEEAIAFLFTASDEQATFTDRFIGPYLGTIEQVQFAQASYSPKEGYGGLVQVTVRESS